MKIREILVEGLENIELNGIKRQLIGMSDDEIKELLSKVERYKSLKKSIYLWLLKEVNKYKIEQTDLLRREDRDYYIEMIKASNFSAQLFNIPSLQTLYHKLPEEIRGDLEDFFTSYTQKGKMEEFKEIVDGIDDINVGCIGKECWNWQLFKNTYVNDKMREIESSRGE